MADDDAGSSQLPPRSRFLPAQIVGARGAEDHYKSPARVYPTAMGSGTAPAKTELPEVAREKNLDPVSTYVRDLPIVLPNQFGAFTRRTVS
jgi:hypothetical protein